MKQSRVAVSFLVALVATGCTESGTPTEGGGQSNALALARAPRPSSGRITFTSHRGGNTDIYLMNADGSGVTRVTSSLAVDHFGRLSPNGKQIAFDNHTFDAVGGDLFVVNTDGSGLVRLTTDPNGEGAPDWSNNGKKLVFMRDSGTGSFAIWVINTDGSGETQLTDGTLPGLVPGLVAERQADRLPHDPRRR